MACKVCNEKAEGRLCKECRERVDRRAKEILAACGRWRKGGRCW